MSSKSLILDNVKVLTTDPERRIGIYAIRYLGKVGAKVDSIGIKERSIEPLGFNSKYLNKRIYFHGGDYRSQLRDLLNNKSGNYDVINPIDVSKMIDLLVIDNNKKKLFEKYLLPYKDSLQISDNKEKITEHAQSIGVSCPKTYTRIEPSRLEKPGMFDITFPCIIKFRGDNRISHWRPEERYRIVHSRKDLISAYSQMHSIEEYPIIQEYIEGVGVGFFALYNREKQLMAQFCHQRIREYPISGGPSSCCESIYDERLVKLGRNLLESLGWMGLAMVEFKYDKKRDKFYLLEINPRYWGSLPLAVYSGVNFPVLHVLSILNIKFNPIYKYNCNVKMRFINTDIKSIMNNFFNKSSFIGKCNLVKDLLDFKIKEGFLTIDDINMIVRSIFHKNRCKK